MEFQHRDFHRGESCTPLRAWSIRAWSISPPCPAIRIALAPPFAGPHGDPALSSSPKHFENLKIAGREGGFGFWLRGSVERRIYHFSLDIGKHRYTVGT